MEYTKAAVLEKQRARSWREVYEGGGVGETVKEEHLTWSVRRRRFSATALYRGVSLFLRSIN